MSIVYSNSVLYSSQGQKFSSTIDQGSTYLGASYENRITFDNTLTITEPRSEALAAPTVANYPMQTNSFFMGSFDGFWIHKLYLNGDLVMTVQGVDQDMYIPVFHDRVESVSMGFAEGGSIPCPDCPVRPPVPAPAAAIVLAFAAIVTLRRRKHR